MLLKTQVKIMSIKEKLIDMLKDNFNVGVLSIIVGFTATLFDDFLGFLLGLIVLGGGIFAVAISKRQLWLKTIVLSLTLILVLFRMNVLPF